MQKKAQSLFFTLFESQSTASPTTNERKSGRRPSSIPWHIRSAECLTRGLRWKMHQIMLTGNKPVLLGSPPMTSMSLSSPSFHPAAVGGPHRAVRPIDPLWGKLVDTTGGLRIPKILARLVYVFLVLVLVSVYHYIRPPKCERTYPDVKYVDHPAETTQHTERYHFDATLVSSTRFVCGNESDEYYARLSMICGGTGTCNHWVCKKRTRLAKPSRLQLGTRTTLAARVCVMI